MEIANAKKIDKSLDLKFIEKNFLKRKQSVINQKPK